MNFGSETNKENVVSIEQAFSTECPLHATGTFNDEKAMLTYENNSKKVVTNWGGCFVFYDAKSKIMVGEQGNSVWRFKNEDTLTVDVESTWEYTTNIAKAMNVLVYIYYAKFSDETTWGVEEPTEDQAIRYGKKFTLKKDLSKYYIGDYGLFIDEEGSERSEIMTGIGFVLNLGNNSSQPILAYEGIIVQYNVYGEKLRGENDSSFYKKLTRNTVNLKPGKFDFNLFANYQSTKYAEVYIYYVLYEDRSSWGYRDVSVEQAMDNGKKFIIHRTS